MAITLANEQSLRRRQDHAARELRFLKRIRILAWSGTAVCLAAGIATFFLEGRSGLLFFGVVLVFVTIGQELRRRETAQELAETEGIRDAKQTVARLLDEKLANDHYVLNDLHLQVGREKCWIDHLVVAPSGMFVLNTLNWSGKIVGDTSKQAHIWKIRGPDGKLRTARNPLGRALRERRILCNWLKGTSLIWERVYPVVVLAHPQAEIQVANAERRVLAPEAAVAFINDFCFEKPVLSGAEVEKLARGLNDGADKP
jgi:hypothetical protein